MLHLENVHKTFKTGFIPKKVIALDNLNLHVDEGEVYAFIGPNGAGKTTTIKLVLGLISPDAGRISLRNQELVEKTARRTIGYLPDQPYFYGDLSAKEYLKFTARLFGIHSQEISRKTEALLELVGLAHKADVRLRAFSRGMLQRIGMAQALIHDPDLLILDEPMTGLDPLGRKELRDIIVNLKHTGKTIFFSSHILSDAEMISDKVGIIRKGRLLREMNLKELQNQSMNGIEVVFRCQDISVEKLPWSVQSYQGGGTIAITSPGEVPEVVSRITQVGGSIVSVIPKCKTLEEIFIEEVHS
jgi:ABC-2 type transport system ATP-binding protein